MNDSRLGVGRRPCEQGCPGWCTLCVHVRALQPAPSTQRNIRITKLKDKKKEDKQKGAQEGGEREKARKELKGGKEKKRGRGEQKRKK